MSLGATPSAVITASWHMYGCFTSAVATAFMLIRRVQMIRGSGCHRCLCYTRFIVASPMPHCPRAAHIASVVHFSGLQHGEHFAAVDRRIPADRPTIPRRVHESGCGDLGDLQPDDLAIAGEGVRRSSAHHEATIEPTGCIVVVCDFDTCSAAHAEISIAAHADVLL